MIILNRSLSWVVALCRISSSVVGLISGVPTSAAPRLVLQISDLHLRRYPIHKNLLGGFYRLHWRACAEAIAVHVKDFEKLIFCCPQFEKKKWHRNKELTAVQFEPGTPGTEITELPTKPQGSWRVLLIEKAICLWFLFFYMDPWTKCFFSGQQEVEEHLVIFRRVGKEGGSWYIVCTANNYETREQFTKMFCTWYLSEMHVKTARRELRPGKTWPPGPSSFTGVIPIQDDFTGMRQLQENSSPPFIIRTEKPRRIVCLFSKTW